MDKLKDKTTLEDFEAITLKLASPEQILSWSHGEVTKPETINYRTGRPERDGLFDERIFGPTKDWECYCGKYRRIRYKGIICDKCGVEVTRSSVRRERMGHIQLAAPVSHVWFLRGIPSKIGLLLDLSVNDLEKVVYFAGYIITKIDEERRKQALEEIEKEFHSKLKESNTREQKEQLKKAKEEIKKDLRSLSVNQVISEVEYHRLGRKFGDIFEAAIGAEAIYSILKRIDLEELEHNLLKQLEGQTVMVQKKILRRLRVVRGMRRTNIRPEWMLLTVIPVIPPDLRPMVQLDGSRYASSDLNDLYRRVINRNNRLKRLYELNAPEVIIRNEKRMLQEAVDALIDNSIRRGSAPVSLRTQRRPLKSLADILKGKQGRFRRNLLGKRVDYSGRSVIVVGPELKMHQCGIPKKMALELFKPFVIRRLIELEIVHNVRSANRLIDDQDPRVWEALDDVIEGRYVLLNRAPTLHRLGIQAFQPVLIEGNSIQVHPLVCPAFNADFDGDQMAVHLPLSREAQQEAEEIMLSAKNLLKPATGAPIVNPNQDIVLGCYYATTIVEGAKGEGKIFSSEKEAVLAYDFGYVDLRARIKVRIDKPLKDENHQEAELKSTKPKLIETSVGRILFNRILPDDFPFVNRQLKKGGLSEVVAEIIKSYGIDNTPPVLDLIKDFGFKYATISGISWGMTDLVIPPEKKELVENAEKEMEKVLEQFQRGLLTDRERYNKVVEIWQGVVDEITELVTKNLNSLGSVYSMVDSKARGSWTQIRQMAGIRGLVVNPAGRIIELPVISSYKEGLNVLEFFISTHGARKGTADTALRTSAAGYLTRRLVDVAQDIIVVDEDCGTKKGITITKEEAQDINKTLGQRAFSRVLSKDIVDKEGKILLKAGQIVDLDGAQIIDDNEIENVTVRSPMTCESLEGVCRICYGYDLGNNQKVELGAAVGVVAAQAIGEPGTQLTMRTFHIGGVAGGSDITTGLPRVQEIFEVRPPKGKATLCDVDGEVIEIKAEGKERVIRVIVNNPTKTSSRGAKGSGKDEVHEFRVPSTLGVLVEVGQEVKKGQILTEGHADLREMFKLTGEENTKKYIVQEVQKIYSRQGAPIHDKHIEIIVRQMFSRVRIKDPGDTDFNIGEIVEKRIFYKENIKAKKEGRKPATALQLILGITRVALTTASFLSAASFQETVRILIDAAIRGKVDELRGLKENVIIGRLIPAGTGFRKK